MEGETIWIVHFQGKLSSNVEGCRRWCNTHRQGYRKLEDALDAGVELARERGFHVWTERVDALRKDQDERDRDWNFIASDLDDSPESVIWITRVELV